MLTDGAISKYLRGLHTGYPFPRKECFGGNESLQVRESEDPFATQALARAVVAARVKRP